MDQKRQSVAVVLGYATMCLQRVDATAWPTPCPLHQGSLRYAIEEPHKEEHLLDATLVFRTYGKWIAAGLDDEKRGRLLQLYARTDRKHANEFPSFA